MRNQLFISLLWATLLTVYESKVVYRPFTTQSHQNLPPQTSAILGPHMITPGWLIRSSSSEDLNIVPVHNLALF